MCLSCSVVFVSLPCILACVCLTRCLPEHNIGGLSDGCSGLIQCYKSYPVL